MCIHQCQRWKKIVLGLFIDDGMVAAAYEDYITSLLNYLTQQFEIRVLDAEYFLGFEIDQPLNGSIHLSQKAYTRKILTKFRMMESNSVSTPAECNNVVSSSNSTSSYPLRGACKN